MTTTDTPETIRPHIVVAEIQEDAGYRWWTSPCQPTSLGSRPVDGAGLSDYDFATTCWCVTEG